MDKSLIGDCRHVAASCVIDMIYWTTLGKVVANTSSALGSLVFPVFIAACTLS